MVIIYANLSNQVLYQVRILSLPGTVEPKGQLDVVALLEDLEKSGRMTKLTVSV